MKVFPIAAVLVLVFGAAAGRAQQSPLAPPVVPKPTDSGKSTTLRIGDKAPDFALPNGEGKLVLLSEYTQRSPVLLVFYRGFW